MGGPIKDEPTTPSATKIPDTTEGVSGKEETSERNVTDLEDYDEKADAEFARTGGFGE